MTQPRTCPVAAFQLSTPCSKFEARPVASACPPAASTPSRAAGPRTSSTGCSVGTPPPGRCEAESSGAQLADLTPGEQPHTVYPYVLITGRLLGHYHAGMCPFTGAGAWPVRTPGPLRLFPGLSGGCSGG